MYRYILIILAFINASAFSAQNSFIQQAQSMEPVRIPKGSPVRYVLFGNAKRLAIYTTNKTVEIYNTETGKIKLTLDTGYVTHDKMLTTNHLLATFDLAKMQLWDLKSGTKVKEVQNMYKNKVHNMFLLQDGVLMTFGSDLPLEHRPRHHRTFLKRWNFRTGELISQEPDVNLNASSDCSAAALIKSTKYEVAVRVGHRKIKIFDSKKEGAILEFESKHSCDSINSILPLKNGDLVVLFSSYFEIFSTETGESKTILDMGSQEGNSTLYFRDHGFIEFSHDIFIGINNENTPSPEFYQIDSATFNSLQKEPKYLSNGDKVTLSEKGVLEVYKKGEKDFCILRKHVSETPNQVSSNHNIHILPDDRLFESFSVYCSIHYLAFYTTSSSLKRKAIKEKQKRKRIAEEAEQGAEETEQNEQEDEQGGCPKDD